MHELNVRRVSNLFTLLFADQYQMQTVHFSIMREYSTIEENGGTDQGVFWNYKFHQPSPALPAGKRQDAQFWFFVPLSPACVRRMLFFVHLESTSCSATILCLVYQPATP